MEACTDVKEFLPIDTRVKHIVAEFMLNMPRLWTTYVRPCDTGSAYLRVYNENNKAVLFRISDHRSEDYKGDFNFIYPRFHDFDVLKFVRLIVYKVSKYFNVKLNLPTSSNLSKLFVTKEKKCKKKKN